MITVSRICADAFKDSIFSGECAFLNGGRWNSQGNRVIYTAQSLSLATLELLVHLDARQINNNLPLQRHLICEYTTKPTMGVEPTTN